MMALGFWPKTKLMYHLITQYFTVYWIRYSLRSIINLASSDVEDLDMFVRNTARDGIIRVAVYGRFVCSLILLQRRLWRESPY